MDFAKALELFQLYMGECWLLMHEILSLRRIVLSLSYQASSTNLHLSEVKHIGLYYVRGSFFYF